MERRKIVMETHKNMAVSRNPESAFCGKNATKIHNNNYECTLNCVTKQVNCEKMVVFSGVNREPK